ncbi:45609_t:CDS:2, partial [Gigaspora margarita]
MNFLRTSLNRVLTRKYSYLLTNLPKRKLLKCQQRQTSNLSQVTRTGSSFPSIEGIKKWSPAQIVDFLESGDLYLTNNEIEMIKKSNIAGKDFILLKEDHLDRIGLSIGSVKRIILLIKKISRSSLVHVFIDSLNLWNEGKYTVGNLEQLGTFDFDRNSYYFKQLQIDHGKLLTTVQDGRKLSGASFLVGPRPPPNDSLWARIRDQGFEVNIFIEISEATMTQNFKTSAETQLDCGDMVLELSFLKSDTIFQSLDNCYRSFSYGLGPDFIGKNQVLEVTDELFGDGKKLYPAQLSRNT